MYSTVVGMTKNKDLEGASLTQSNNDKEQEQELGENNPVFQEDDQEHHQEAARALNGHHQYSPASSEGSPSRMPQGVEEQEERKYYWFKGADALRCKVIGITA